MDTAERLEVAGAARAGRSGRVAEAFFATRAEAVSRASWDIARRFRRGGRVMVHGRRVATDPRIPVDVEHDLPLLLLEGDPLGLVEALGRPEDILLTISPGGEDEVAAALRREAEEKGLLTVGIGGGPGGSLAREPWNHFFFVPHDDPTVVRDVHETLYQVLWDLVHVFVERYQGVLSARR